MVRRFRAPIAARLVLLLGCGAAAALIAATFLDLGDPGATAQARLEAEAESEGSLVRTRWREKLTDETWLADADAARTVRIEPPLALAPSLVTSAGEDEDDRVRLVATRAAAARGDDNEVRRLTEAVIARGGALSGDALLHLVRHLRGADESAAGAAYLTLADGVPWTAAVDGTSGRLLALLSVGESLAPNDRTRACEAFVAALDAGGVALPAPMDTASAATDGFEVALDPWWSVLRETADERLPSTGLDWSAVFREAARSDMALARATAPAESATWTLTAIDGSAWLAARLDGDRLRVAVHSNDALAAAVEALSLGAGDLAAVAFTPRDDLAFVSDAGTLQGTDLSLTIEHPDPAAVARRERRRLSLLRGGLAALALLVLLTTAVASRLIARARALHALRSTFVASVSHDLRTPLASISLMAENLASGYAKGNEERYVESIRRETGRLGRLVDDLLDFGRIERGLLPNVSRAPVAVDEWLDLFEARERARCTAAGCGLSVERSDLPDTAQLDVGALERALSNLVDNALKHADTDAIRLRVHGEHGGVLAFEVEDAGKGLPRGVVHEHLFQPFRRQGETGGTGLGLAIVRAIAEAHGGSATLSPGPGGVGLRATLQVDGDEEGSAA